MIASSGKQLRPGAIGFPRTPTGRRGVVLLFVAGILSLLLLVAVAFLAQADAAGRRALSGETSTRLAAESGLEYAAARLPSGPAYPLYSRTAADRGDDWTCRQGSDNPSYSHGESWTEGAAPDGRFAKGEIPGPDLDGDGRFSAWSGRMRGGAGARPARFSLHVESAGGRIPLNSGFLDALDRNGGGPDCADLGFLHHAGLAHALNNLGARVLPETHPRRFWQGAPGTPLQTSNPREPVRYSSLGFDLIRNRPPGGYRTGRQVAEVLSGLGGGSGYPAGLQEVLPYLDLSAPPVASVQGGPPWSDSPSDSSTRTPAAQVELSTASPAVLQSLWQYLTGVDQFSGDDSDWELDPRTGSGPSMRCYCTENLILFPDEAQRLAAHAVEWRRTSGSNPSWNGFYRSLMEEAESMDEDLYAPSPSDGKLFRSAIDALAHPRGHARTAQMKADLAFHALSPDPLPTPEPYPKTWSGWGIPRYTGSQDPPGTPLLLPYDAKLSWREVQRLPLPSPAVPGIPYADPAALFDCTFSVDATRRIAPLSLTLRPPVRFLVESAGSTGGTRERGSAFLLAGTLGVAERLDLSSQEDFENLSGSPELERTGIRTANGAGFWIADPADPGRREQRLEPGGRIVRTVVSLPAWDRRSYPPGDVPEPPGLSRLFGALVLGRREGGGRGAQLYWPMGEADADTPLSALFAAERPAPLPPVPWMTGPGEGISPDLWQPPSENFFGPLGVSGGWMKRIVLDPALTVDGPGLLSGESTLTFEAWGGPQGGRSGMVWISSGAFDICSSVSSSFAGGERVSDICVRDMRAGSSAIVHASMLHEEETSSIHHWMVAVERLAPGRTRFRLYLDGQQVDWKEIPKGFPAGTVDTMLPQLVGEIRLHSAARDAAYARSTYAEGRFVERGTYASPLYRLDAPARLLHAQWTGIFPPGSGPGAIAVKVVGYRDDGGASLAAAIPLPPGSGTLSDLERLGMPAGIRSFRYIVNLDGGPAPRVDTPIFESIWISFRRRKPRAWLSFGSEG